MEKSNPSIKKEKQKTILPCPYPGLRSFNERESIYFKGRENHIDRIIEKLQEHKFLLVTGASGDGKSSLIFAGLIPNCRAGFFRSKFNKWSIVNFRPERAPLRNLSEALSPYISGSSPDAIENTLRYGYGSLSEMYRSSSMYIDLKGSEWLTATDEKRKEIKQNASNLLIIVDQFEEFFTNEENFNRQTSTATEHTQVMVSLLLETTRIAKEQDIPIYIICTMRSDYLGQCAALPGFPEKIVESQFYLPRLTRRDIIQVIEEPAMLSGNSISERLIQRLLNDIHDGRDILPVLQHCLNRIWHSADKGNERMDLLHYAMVGGISREQLDEYDQQVFDEWYRTQPESRKKQLEHPSLTNVLNMHANEIYETAHESIAALGISRTDAQFIVETSFRCLAKIDDNRAIRNLMKIKEIWEMTGKEKHTLEQVTNVLNIFRAQGNTLIRPFLTEQPEKAGVNQEIVLDITHESLIRNWERLHKWAWTEHESVQTYREFRSQMDKWIRGNKKQEHLMSVGSLAYFEGWYKSQKVNAEAWLGRYMFEEEKQNRETEQLLMTAEFSERKQRITEHYSNMKEYIKLSRRQITRKTRIAAAAVSIICILLIGVTIAYFKTERLNAEISRTKHANEIATAAYLKLSSDPTLAYRLAEQAYFVEPTPLAKQVIMASYGEVPFYMKLEGHTGGGCTVAKYSDDGNIIASLTGDEIVKIWDTKSFILLSECKGHKGAHGPNSNSLNISPNSKYIVSASTDSTARIWNLEGKCLAVLKHDGSVNSAYFSPKTINELRNDPAIQNEIRELLQKEPKGEYLVLTASSDKTARLWDMEGKELGRFEGHVKGLNLSKFSNSGIMLATSSLDNRVILWHIDGKQIKSFQHLDNVRDIAFSHHTDFVVTACMDNIVRKWDLNNFKSIEFKGHEDYARWVEISPNDSLILSASKDNSIKLWNSNGQELQSMEKHTSFIWGIKFSPDGQKIISASDDGTTRLWNLEGIELMLFKGHSSQVMSANFSPDGKYVVTASGDATARVWNVEMKENTVFRGHRGVIFDCRFWDSGKEIITSGADYSSKLWNFSGKLLNSFNKHDHYSVEASDFIPNSDKLLSVSFDGNLRVRNRNGNVLQIFQYQSGYSSRILYSQNRKKIICLNNDNKAQLYEINDTLKFQYEFNDATDIDFVDNNLICLSSKDSSIYFLRKLKANDSLFFQKFLQLKIPGTSFSTAEFSKDGNWLATVTEDSTIRIWEIKFLLELEQKTQNIELSTIGKEKVLNEIKVKSILSAIIFSSTENKFISISNDNFLQLWNVQGQLLSEMKGHSDAINDANFSYKGKFIVTASNDNTAKVWDLEGNNIITITNHKAAVMKAKFSPDNKYILTASMDQDARLTPWIIEDILNKINVEKVRGEVWELGQKEKEVFRIKTD